MSDSAHNPDDYCYRHPDRLSFVLCERCGRTICLECQNHVDGRVLCPDDAQARVTQISAARASHDRHEKQMRRRTRVRLLDRVNPETPIVTYILAAISLIVSILANVPNGFGISVQIALIYQAPAFAPWQPITAAFINPSILGLLINIIVFVLFGRAIEPLFGRGRFIAIFFIGSFGGAVGAIILGGFGYAGISMATMALAACFFLVQRHHGRTDFFLLAILIFNIILSIVVDGQWQATIGAIAFGALTGLVLTRTRRIPEGRPQNMVLLAAVIVLYLVAASGAFIYRATH